MQKHIGWTAFYTAAVWHKLGVPGAALFVTSQGRFLAWVVGWGGGFLGLAGRYSVTNLFLASRHLGINRLLAQLQPTQVLELAAGLSARGAEWTRHHACRYVEVDQSHVIAAKQVVLARDKRPLAQDATHLLIVNDLLAANTSQNLPLDPILPTLVIAEGFTGYLSEAALRNLLNSIKIQLNQFENVTLLIDLYVRLNYRQHGRVALAMWPAQKLWQIMRAPMQMFLSDSHAIEALLKSEGFEIIKLYSATDLANLANYPAPPLDLFYLAHVKLAQS